MALSSPDRTSPALIGLPGFGVGSAYCAHAEGAAKATAMMTAKRERMPNRRFVMGQFRLCG
jgi:hypothetical protein